MVFMEKKIEAAKSGKHPSQVKELILDNCDGPIKLESIGQFNNLESLSINNVGLTTLKGFPRLQKLRKLEMCANKLTGDLHFLNGCINLAHLNLTGNRIKNIESLRPLEKLKKLQSLILINCDVTKTENYRKSVFTVVSNLQDLDGEDKKPTDSASAGRMTRSSAKKKDSTECVTPQPVPKVDVKEASNTDSESTKIVTPEKNGQKQMEIDDKQKEKPEEMETEIKNESVDQSESSMNEDGANENDAANKKSKKRQWKKDGFSPRKKRKTAGHMKNALMQLNELRPGLKYTVESQSGPPHDPVFVVSVEVDNQKYIGRGNSKQLAKHAAAQAALASFIQFRDMPEAVNAMSRPPVTDFTADNDEAEGFSFNKYEVRKNGTESEVIISAGTPVLKKPLKMVTEADKKNPVMLLNEVHPGLTFNMAEENNMIPSQRFRMVVEVGGEFFEGTGQNKKLAKANAARAVLGKFYKVNYGLDLANIASTPATDPNVFTFPQAVADKISKLISSTFSEVMTGNPEKAKWKVLAGVAMTKTDDMEDVQIVTLGTGTKCINGEYISMNGAVLNDCHAEIISRRCLKDFFYSQLEMHMTEDAGESIFEKRENGGFRLKPDVRFHLFISTSPCGDARVFSPHEESGDPIDRHPNRKARGVLRTKIESGEGTIPIRPGMMFQTWDSIMTGQERLLTMSCSDKIALWNVVGIQGALLSCFVEPVYFHSIILGSLFHPNHLYRALIGRIEDSPKDLPPLYASIKPKLCGLTNTESRQVAKSPNFSVNWTVGQARPEVINSSTGKPEDTQVSRLAKRSFFQRFLKIYEQLQCIVERPSNQPSFYVGYKHLATDYQDTKKIVCSAFTSAGLGNWINKPAEEGEFEMTF